MRVHVAFTPDEEASAPVGVVVDVLRATSTIAQALSSGYRRVLCCAEFEGAFALDDAYCAGRIVALLRAERSDAAIAAELVAGSFSDAHSALVARTYGPPGLEEDILFCSRESVLSVVPRLAAVTAPAAEIAA